MEEVTGAFGKILWVGVGLIVLTGGYVVLIMLGVF